MNGTTRFILLDPSVLENTAGFHRVRSCLLDRYLSHWCFSSLNVLVKKEKEKNSLEHPSSLGK